MCSFKLQMHQNLFSVGALSRTSLGSLRRHTKPPSRLGREYPSPYLSSLDASISSLRLQHLGSRPHTNKKFWIRICC